MAAEREHAEGQWAVLTRRVVVIETALSTMGDQLQNIQDVVTKAHADTSQRLDALEGETIAAKVDSTNWSVEFGKEKTELLSKIGEEMLKYKSALMSIADVSKKDSDMVRQGMQDLHDKTAAAFQQVQEQVKGFGMTAPRVVGDTGGHKYRGYLPTKQMVPKTFDGTEERWRSWQEDVMDYMDTVQPGVKDLLKAIEVTKERVDREWLRSHSGKHTQTILDDGENVWRFLKQMTDGEARKVVTGVTCGYEAWSKLHRRFGPSLAAKQGMVLNDLVAMVQKPAKSPSETKGLVTELERRVKMAEDVTKNTMDDNHLKSILVALLDPLTRQHTTMHQGADTTYDMLKRYVLEFANNVTVRCEATAMQIGRVCDSPDDGDCQRHCDAAFDAEWDDYLAAVSKGTQCYQCGGVGHMARECPSKGKGKGAKGNPMAEKGKSKGKGKAYLPGKGGSKGPMGGCWTCGGTHFQRDCPAQKGKGKGGKGLNSLEDDWSHLYDVHTNATGNDVKTLSRCQLVRTHNSFAALQEKENADDDVDPSATEGVGQTPSPTARVFGLAEFIRDRARQGETKSVRRSIQRASRGTPRGKDAEAEHRRLGQLRLFRAVEPEGLNNATEARPKWEVIELAVDSGATETVIGEDMLKSVSLRESAASRRGVKYEVANGVQIPNLGEKAFGGFTDGEGLSRRITAQVCEVNKALLSVHKLVKAGNRVVFDQDGSYIEERATEEKIWLQEQGGMYMLKMWVPAEDF